MMKIGTRVASCPHRMRSLEAQTPPNYSQAPRATDTGEGRGIQYQGIQFNAKYTTGSRGYTQILSCVLSK